MEMNTKVLKSETNNAPMSEAEIIYALVTLSKLSALANMIGGVIRPIHTSEIECGELRSTTYLLALLKHVGVPSQ